MSSPDVFYVAWEGESRTTQVSLFLMSQITSRVHENGNFQGETANYTLVKNPGRSKLFLLSMPWGFLSQSKHTFLARYCTWLWGWLIIFKPYNSPKGIGIAIPILQIKQLRLKKIKSLVGHHATRQWQNHTSSPSLFWVLHPLLPRHNSLNVALTWDCL